MTGGLLQIVSSGRQDIYLTRNPEITFFKKVFKRHTNFATELNRITPETDVAYGETISFTLNLGDCIGKCYMEVNLPYLSFSDKYITNTTYLNRKQTQLSNMNTELTKWTNYYTNLKGYCDIEIKLYRLLQNLLLSENITINILQDQVNKFNQINKINKDYYKNKIDPKVYTSINMTGYINSINLLITNLVPNPDPTKYIEIITIIDTLNTMYNMMTQNLIFYNNKINASTPSTNMISFNYAEFLGHNFFEYFILEIGGQEITRYTNEILHINQMHSIKQEYMENYMEMIGNIPTLNTFDVSSKGNYKLLIPLIFWFNKENGLNLPLVALQYSTVKITAKISNLNKIVCFQNYTMMFDNIVNISIDMINGFVLDKKLLYTSYNFDLVNKKINYNCILINKELLYYAFPDLTESEINILLTNAGSQYTLNQITKMIHPELSDSQIQELNGIDGLNTQYVINKNQWVAFMLNITNSIYNTLAPKVGSYYPYINFNLYYGLIPNPTVNLITEVAYLDDLERSKFADSKLEYVVENFDENIYNISNQFAFDCELSFLNPCKELLWFFQPQIYIDGLTPYGQNISLLFDINKYFTNSFFTQQKLVLEQYDVLVDNIDNNFYTDTLSYKYLNNVLPKGVYYNSFSLFPEESQPSGTVNLTEIKNKQYKVLINSIFLLEYNNFLKEIYGSNSNLISSKLNFTLKFISKNYDLLTVHKGSCKLLFSI